MRYAVPKGVHNATTEGKVYLRDELSQVYDGGEEVTIAFRRVVAAKGTRRPIASEGDAKTNSDDPGAKD